jgi:hypothetical protein
VTNRIGSNQTSNDVIIGEREREGDCFLNQIIKRVALQIEYDQNLVIRQRKRIEGVYFTTIL